MRRIEPRAAAVLQMLCASDGAVVTRQELLDSSWGEGEGSDEALTQAVAQIRRILDELGEPGSVETLAKRGYRLRASAGQYVAARSEPVLGSWRGVYAWLTVAVIIVAAALLFPHGARHAIRHPLGLGPHSHSESH